MKVLLISHTCQSRTEGQPKAEHLARIPGLELRVLVPDRWRHYGKWRWADVGHSAFRFAVGKVRWPWVGPAQFYLHWYPELRELLAEFRPDVIDLWEEPWGLVSAHACWLRNRMLPGAKILSETEQNLNKVLPFPFERIRRYTLRHTDCAIGRSAEAVRVLREKGYDGPATVVPNAADATLFRPMDREACKRKLGLSGFICGYVGRLVPEKGLMDLIDAIAGCPKDVHVVLVGRGPLEAELASRAETMGCGRNIHFIGGKALEQLPELMNAFDTLVLPSRTTVRWKEQFGRVIIEAHACGVPVIGSGSGAITDVVGEGGLAFPEGETTALANAILQLRNDPALARRLGKRGRLQVEAKYTWQRVAEQMYETYRRVHALPRRRRVWRFRAAGDTEENRLSEHDVATAGSGSMP